MQSRNKEVAKKDAIIRAFYNTTSMGYVLVQGSTAL